METLTLLFLNLNVADSTAVQQEIASSGNKEPIWLFVGLGVIVLAIVHMFLTFKLKRYEAVTLDDMKTKRKGQNKNEESSEEEDELAMNYLNDVFDHWTTVSGAGEEELKAPTRKAHLNTSLKALEKVKDMAPTDPDVVDRLNELGDVVNSNSKRSFTGSIALIIVSLIITVIMYYTGKTDNETVFAEIMSLWWLWGSIIFYIVASFAPQFLIDKRLRKLGSGNFSSGLVGFFAGLFFAAPTFSTLTRYSDGTSSRSTDFNIIGLFLMFIGLMFIGIFIIAFGLLNYLRNYVIYF